jgi:hypothetical protein
MLAEITLATFVTSFISVVVLGHVLLVAALWPDPRRQQEKHIGNEAGEHRAMR